MKLKRTIELEVPDYGSPMDLDDIKRVAATMGSHWFDPETLRFFRCRINPRITTAADGWYFISSEQSSWDAERRYSIRRVSWEREDFTIDTIGDFQQYGSLAAASAALRKHLAR